VRNSVTNSDGYCDANSHSDGYGNCNADSDSNGYSYTYGYGNFYTDTDAMHGEMFTHAETAPDSGTSTVMDAGLATERFCPNVHFGDCAMNCPAPDASRRRCRYRPEAIATRACVATLAELFG
jgi:hypothetical protein